MSEPWANIKTGKKVFEKVSDKKDEIECQYYRLTHL